MSGAGLQVGLPLPCPGSAVAPEAARAAVASATVTSFVRRIPYLRGLVLPRNVLGGRAGDLHRKSLRGGRRSYSRFTLYGRFAGTVPIRGLSLKSVYFSSTVAPASSSWPLIVSASSLARPSLTGLGALSTRSLASLRPRPVTARTTLITWIFWPPAAVSTTSKADCSSSAAAPSPPGAAPAAATATGAAAVTPHSSSSLFFSSTRSRTVMPPSSWTSLSVSVFAITPPLVLGSIPVPVLLRMPRSLLPPAAPRRAAPPPQAALPP